MYKYNCQNFGITLKLICFDLEMAYLRNYSLLTILFFRNVFIVKINFEELQQTKIKS